MTGNLRVLALEGDVALLQNLGHEIDRLDDPRRPPGRAGQGPIERPPCGVSEAQLDRLHRLPKDSVEHDHDRRPISFRQLECVGREIHCLTDRGRSKNRDPVVAVAVALRGLEVVALRWPDAAQARPGAHDVDEHHRRSGAGHVAHRLGHEADPRARRRNQDPGASCRRAQGHVDRPELALGLDEDATELRHTARHPLQQFGLRRDGVAEIGVAAGLNRRLGHGIVALHKDASAALGLLLGRLRALAAADFERVCHRARSSREASGELSRGAAQTVKTASGQTRAQRAQLVQADASVRRTG